MKARLAASSERDYKNISPVGSAIPGGAHSRAGEFLTRVTGAKPSQE
jgi:hypothetical protein